jgi:hypothetical protein
MYTNIYMYEFRVNRRKLSTFTHSNLIAGVDIGVKSRAVRGARGALATASENTEATKKSYKMDFNNIFANINNVKPGCRKCGAAR